MDNLKKEILKIVEERDHASFIELKKVNGFDGDVMYLIDGVDNKPVSNCVIWAGMSDKAFDAITFMRNKNIIDIVPCSLFVYLIDGGALNMPLFKSYRHYKKPHWLPTVLTRGKKWEKRHKILEDYV